MESFASFQEELFHGDNMLYWAFSPEPAFDLIAAVPEPTLVEPPVVLRSAFELYTRTENEYKMEASSSGSRGRRNIHRRVIEMLQRIPNAKEDCRGVETSRGFRHMMRERQRREKLSQSYADLYSMLSTRSKGDKNSIVQSAALYVRELKGVKDQLQRRNEELKSMILGTNGKTEEANVKFRVANPSSAIDSLIGAFQCLKSMDVKARAIRADLSGKELSAIMSIETKIAADEVERAVEGALREAEAKLLRPLPRTH
ncbi:transcription factor BHLH148-like [Phoenix dactylifera]|uniref:Transcription factor BHLH148-like n=1 Tax=Phoenix dactylifera TaxID=42345 RepID=A0A8B7BIT0_PHODC|nr:transcription factor BHLH148-like [Phoenix dactylifera]